MLCYANYWQLGISTIPGMKYIIQKFLNSSKNSPVPEMLSAKSGFRIQEMFIQYNYISNLFTYRAHRLSWLGQLSGIFKLMRLINVKFENGIMVYHGFRGKYSAQSQENRNNLDKTSLASSGDFH